MPTIPPRKGVGKKPTRPVQWSPADQARLYASFKWDRPPSTAQVLLAQEELWVYGLLADAIARVNKAAGAADDAAIPLVEELAVGYPAAEDHPGGAAGGRIVMPAAVPQSNLPGDFGPLPSQGPPSQGPPSQGMDAAGGAVVRPPHPRFSGGFGPPMPGAGGPTPPDAPTAADDQLRNWIYVGFSGKPLLAAELGTAPDSMLLHLVPFVLRAVVDERKLDALLVDLATTSVPIDVRQVRINPGGGGSAVPGGRDFAPGMPGGAAASPRSRPNDVVVELRGTVALATPPDRRLLGLENEANASDDAGGGDDPLESSEQAEPEPAAADGGGDRP